MDDLDDLRPSELAIVERAVRKAFAKGRSAGERDGYDRGREDARQMLAFTAQLNGSTHAVLKALDEPHGIPTPTPEPEPADDAPDLHAALAEAMVEAAHEALEAGDDPRHAVEALRSLAGDPAELARVLSGGDPETVAKAVGSFVVRKAFEEGKHPRDHGKFSSKDGGGSGGDRSASKPAGKGESPGLADVRKEIDRAGGDSGKAIDALVSRMRAHMEAGGKVSLWAEGKQVPVASTDGGRVRDAKGLPWGLLPLAMGPPGTKNGVEFHPISPPTPAPTPSKPVPPDATPAPPSPDPTRPVKPGGTPDAHKALVERGRKWADSQATAHAAKLAAHFGINSASALHILKDTITRAMEKAARDGSATLVVKGRDGKFVRVTVRRRVAKSLTTPGEWDVEVEPGEGEAADEPDGGWLIDSVFKAWSEDDHPRGRGGHFIGKDRIEDAKSDPKVAAQLRKEVKPEDAHKLEKVLAGGDSPGRTKRGQAAHEAGQRRADKDETRNRGEKVLAKLKRAGDLKGDLTADDLHDLADHLTSEHVTVGHLREVRRAMQGGLAQRVGFGGAKAKADMVAALVSHARREGLEARMREMGISDEEAAEMRRAVGVAPKGPVPSDREPTLEELETGVRPGGGRRAQHLDPHSRPYPQAAVGDEVPAAIAGAPGAKEEPAPAPESAPEPEPPPAAPKVAAVENPSFSKTSQSRSHGWESGQTIRNTRDGKVYTVTEARSDRDEEGYYSHRAKARPATPDEERRHRIGELRRELRSHSPGPDDERDRERHDAARQKLSDELRSLEAAAPSAAPPQPAPTRTAPVAPTPVAPPPTPIAPAAPVAHTVESVAKKLFANPARIEQVVQGLETLRGKSPTRSQIVEAIAGVAHKDHEFEMLGSLVGSPSPRPGEHPLEAIARHLSAPEATPPAAPEPQATPAATLPDADALAAAPREAVRTEGGLTGGSAQSLYRATVNGKQYAVKSAAKNGPVGEKNAAERAHAEELSSRLAKDAGVSVPAAKVVDIGGKPHVVSEWADGTPLSRGDAGAALKGVKPGEVSRMALFDFATGYNDNHLGNYLVGKDGTLHGIDRESSFGDGLKDMAFHLDENKLLKAAAGAGGDKARDAIPLPREQAAHMAAVADRAAEALAHDPGRAAMARERAGTLRKLAELPSPTVGDLIRLSSDEAAQPTPPAKTQQQIADEVTARRRARPRPGGADDANPTPAEVEAASRPAAPAPAPDMAMLDQQPDAVAPGSRTGDAVARKEAQQAKRSGVPKAASDARAAHKAASPLVRDHLDAAMHNAGTTLGKVATHKDRRDLAAQLASAHGYLHGHPQATPDDHAAMESAIRAMVPGIEKTHAAGDVVPFDGSLHDAPGGGVFTGDRVRVTRPGWVLPGEGGAAGKPFVAGKAATEKASGNSPTNVGTAVDKPTTVGNNPPVEPPKSGGGNAGGGKMEAVKRVAPNGKVFEGVVRSSKSGEFKGVPVTLEHVEVPEFAPTEMFPNPPTKHVAVMSKGGKVHSVLEMKSEREAADWFQKNAATLPGGK